MHIQQARTAFGLFCISALRAFGVNAEKRNKKEHFNGGSTANVWLSLYDAAKW